MKMRVIYEVPIFKKREKAVMRIWRSMNISKDDIKRSIVIGGRWNHIDILEVLGIFCGHVSLKDIFLYRNER